MYRTKLAHQPRAHGFVLNGVGQGPTTVLFILFGTRNLSQIEIVRCFVRVCLFLVPAFVSCRHEPLETNRGGFLLRLAKWPARLFGLRFAGDTLIFGASPRTSLHLLDDLLESLVSVRTLQKLCSRFLQDWFRPQGSTSHLCINGRDMNKHHPEGISAQMYRNGRGWGPCATAQSDPNRPPGRSTCRRISLTHGPNTMIFHQRTAVEAAIVPGLGGTKSNFFACFFTTLKHSNSGVKHLAGLKAARAVVIATIMRVSDYAFHPLPGFLPWPQRCLTSIV